MTSPNPRDDPAVRDQAQGAWPVAAAQEMATLIEAIAAHDHAYYVESRPTISDTEYDRLMDRLKELEAAHPELASADSPTQRVGGAPVEGFAKVAHTVAMMSIENTYNPADLLEWDTSIRKLLPGGGVAIPYGVELKIDGVSLALHYQGGRLAMAVTRGDGRVGDDVTAVIRTVRAIPARLRRPARGELPEYLEVRGELYMPRSEFARVNAALVAEGDEPFKNPRNATSGTLHLKDPRQAVGRGLRYAGYGIAQLRGGPPAPTTQNQSLALLRELGIPTEPHTVLVQGIAAVVETCETWRARRSQLDFDTDGLVVKVDDLASRATLGATSKAARWCRAYKFPAEKATSRLRRVRITVGKTGVVTPTAEFDPVTLAGTTVSSAYLHNYEEVARKDIRLGDLIEIEKAGEIIPQVVRCLPEGRDGSQTPVPIPDQCPECATALVRDPGMVALRCPNRDCPAVWREKLRYFAMRPCMDIDGLGEVIVGQLIHRGLVKTYGDLYRLRAEQVANLDRMGDKSAANLIAGIAASRDRDLSRLITALNILNVGKVMAEKLASHFGSLEALMAADVPALLRIDDVGPVAAAAVVEYFADARHRAMVDDLIACGVNTHARRVVLPGVHDAQAGPLVGKTVVITGTLSRPREHFEELIKSCGGRVSGSVSKKTSYLLAGDDAGSKLVKARELGVAILDETALNALCQRTS